MRKEILVLVLGVVFVMSCVSTERVPQDFSNAEGKEWKLLEVFIDGKNIGFNREIQDQQFSRDTFSMKLDEGTISGLGAPNRYSGRYTQTTNYYISVTPLASTQMAALFENESLREFDYFSYIQNASKLTITNEGSNLELLSVTSDKKPVRLVFGL